MASAKKETLSKNSDTNPVVLGVLINLFGDVLHVDIIKSIGRNCDWKLETASNILAELTASVSNDTVTSKKPNNISPNINSVGYAAAGDNDNNLDVYIETENKFDYKQAVQQGSKNRISNPKKISPVQQIQTKPVQNKSKREIEYDRVREIILTGAKVCILLRGLPGSGKSHLARMIVQTTISEDYRRFIFSTDAYFERNGVYNYQPNLLTDAHYWNQKRVYEAMHLGISPVIIDNTNTQMWEMKAYATSAVHFGYAVEILEPMTVWIFNPPELARRCVHNVPKNKISDMLDRYEKNVTPEKLLSMFALKYSPRNHPPQPRLYPPLSRNIQPLFNIPPSIAKCPNKNQNPPKPKKKRTKKKKPAGQNVESSGTLSKSESMHSILTNDDSDGDSDIDSLNELQTTDSEYCLNDRDVFHDKKETNSKQSNQYQLVNIDDNVQSKNYSKSSADIDLINFDFDDNSKNTYSSDLFSLDNSKVVNSNANVSDVHEKTQQLIDSCVKLFKTVTINKDNSEVDKNLSKPTDYPKINLSSWGLSDDAFTSWEVVDKPKVKEEPKTDPQPQRLIPKEVTIQKLNSNEIGTNTSSDDFALLKHGFVNNPEIRIIPTLNRNIGENNVNTIIRNPNKVSMFDKSTMTGRENVLNAALARSRCSNEDQHFYELVKLFPNVGEDVLRDIFDKCQGDINWAVDLLLDENKDLNLENTEEIGDVASNHIHSSECNCLENVQPEIYIPQETVTELPSLSPEIKKSPTRLKNKVSEESLLLKKQIEEQFKIDETYYSPHVSNIRKKRYGEQEPSTSKEQQFPENLELSDNNAEEVESSEESSEEEIVELNVGLDFIQQLETSCGNPDMDYPKGFQPVMQLPASMVRLLHAYWLESLYQQMDNQTSILETMIKEDEELARTLQMQETAHRNSTSVVPNLQEIMDMEIALAIYKADQEQWKKETPDDLASRMKRQKLFETFPNFDKGALMEIMQTCNNSFDQTVEVLKASMDIPDKNTSTELDKQKELLEKAKLEYIEAKQNEVKLPKIVVKGEIEDEEDGACCSPQKTATQYRDEAAHHLKMRQTCFTKAQEAIKKGSTQVATYYSEIAQMHKQKYEQANNLAASFFLTAHSQIQNSRTLDLHFLYVKEAEQALAMFLDKHISILKTRNKPRETLFIITGRGSHSKDGIAHIKPVVKRHLKDRRLNFVQINPGLLKVILNKHSIMTNDLK